MSEHRDEHLDLCAAMALGAIGLDERRELEEHLAEGCPVCEAALSQASQSAVMIAASAPAATAPRELRGRVLDAFRAEHAASRSRDDEAVAPAPAAESRGRVVRMPREAPRWAPWLSGALAAALAITTLFSFQRAERLAEELRGKRQVLEQLQRQLAEERRWAALMSAPGARVAEMQMTPAGIQAMRARAVYDPGSRSAMLSFEGMSPPPDKDYQLWALRPDGVASLGLVRPDAQGRALMRLDDVGEPSALAGFALSLEPRGGSPNPAAPSGPVVMAGKFDG